MKKYIMILLMSLSASIFSQNVKTGKTGSITIGSMNLSLEQAIDLVLRKNLTLRRSRYDVLKSDSDYLKSKGKYALTLEAEGSYRNDQVPESGFTASFGGSKTTQMDASVALSKIFATGTTVKFGFMETLYDQDDKAIPGITSTADPAYHKPSFYLTLQQDLLKNAFGIYDRKNSRILKSLGEIKRNEFINQLSGLVVEALVDYWTVVVRKFGIKNARAQLKSMQNLRNIISRNIRLGISQAHDLRRVEIDLANARSEVERAEKGLYKAIRKLLRTINMPASTKIEGVTELLDVMPVIDKKSSIEAAFKKRIDYKNALRRFEVAKLNIQLQEHSALPNLYAYMTVSTLGQSDQFTTAIADNLSATYPSWNVGVKLTYPIGDKSTQTSIRDAKYDYAQANIRILEIKKEIRDDVLDRIDEVELRHRVLINSRRAKIEAVRYYNQILKGARRGRFNMEQIKGALFSMTMAKQEELSSLVQFNVALLQLDLSKNEIFERYKIDIEKLLKEVK